MNKNDFPILNEVVYNKPLVYLDNAATTQKPHQVIDAISYAYTHFNANIHRGTHYLSQVATQEYEKVRTLTASFFNAKSTKEIIFTKGTTNSINILAHCYGNTFINEGDEIIIGGQEHHSNIVPWQMLCDRKKAYLKVIPLLEDLSLDITAFQSLITPKTKLVAIAHVSNVLGIINPIKQIIDISHQHNIPVCIDGAQSAAHMPIDLQYLDCDFFVCSAHKMYGPTGVGVLYGKEEWLNRMQPLEGGGEMIEHVHWDKTTYNTLPYKFEAGTPNYIDTYAFGKAIEYIKHIGFENIHSHEKKLVEYAESLLNEINGVHIYAKQIKQKAGVISFNVYNKDHLIHPFDLGTLLDKQGIAVRTGHHCAEPLIDYLNIPGTIRISFALYNTKEDIDLFIQALKNAIGLLI